MRHHGPRGRCRGDSAGSIFHKVEKQALQDFLDDHEEHLLALVRLEKKNPRITLEEMEGRLDLED